MIMKSYCYRSKIWWYILLLVIVPVMAVKGEISASNNNSIIPFSINDDYTKNLNINVYIDASGSMSGFATKNGDSTTKYAQTLERIYGCSGFFSGSIINFYKFTLVGPEKPIIKLENRNFRQAYKWEFYNGATLIDYVVKDLRVEDLTIIVTDLFQNDSDIGTVINVVNERCFSVKNRSVSNSIGLIRISSQFDGAIGQLGSKTAFHHEGIHSFYVIVIGRYPDVRKFNSHLINDLKEGKTEIALDYLLLSPYLIKPLLSFDSIDLSSTKNHKNITRVEVKSSTDQPGLEFRVNTKKAESSFTVEIPLENESNTVRWNNELNLIINSEKLELSSWVEVNFHSKILNVTLNNNDPKTSVNDKRDGRDRINLQFSLKSSNLQKGESYHFVVYVRPKQGSCKMPDWIKKWDMDLSKITSWIDDPSTYDGSTLNLDLFVKRIWNYIETTYTPSIGIFHLYIKAK